MWHAWLHNCLKNFNLEILGDLNIEGEEDIKIFVKEV